MNPLRLSACNYRTFETLDLELPTGLVALTGSNGAGKSSVVNLVDVALFAARGELAPLVTTGDTDDLTLELEFEHAGKTFRVRRGYRKGKVTLDLERWKDAPENSGDDTGPMWVPLSRESADQTQALIEQILGLNRTTFRASAFLRQGDGAAFTEAKPAERKLILSRILDLGVFAQAEERIRRDVRAAEDQLVSSRTRMETAELTAARKPAVETALRIERETEAKLKGDVAALEADLEAARDAEAAAAEYSSRMGVLSVEKDAAVAARNRIGDQVDEARKASQDHGRLQADLAVLLPIVAKLDELERQVAARQEAIHLRDAALRQQREAEATVERQMQRIDELRRAHALTNSAQVTIEGRLSHLRTSEDGTERCAECAQILGREARLAAIESLDGQLTKLYERNAAEDTGIDEAIKLQQTQHQDRAAITVPDVPSDDCVHDLDRARQAAERKISIDTQLETLQLQAARLPELERQWEAANDDLEAKQLAVNERLKAAPSLDLVSTELIRGSIVRQRELHTSCVTAIARAEAELERIMIAEAELAGAREEQSGIATRIGQLKLCEKCASRDGVPALIVEAIAVPQIETEANRILTELGTSYQVELRTQTIGKSTDTVSETLDIIIHDGPYERPYETYSGGERTRLNVALRIALARLLARRRGAESRLLVIDEPEYLDESGVTRLADVLRGLSGDFDRILLVSHHPSAAASCDVTLQVVKDNDRSRIIDGTQLRVAA